MTQIHAQDKGRFQYDVQDLTKYMKFRQYKNMTFLAFSQQIVTTMFTSLLSHQLLYLLQPRTVTKKHISIQRKIYNNFKVIRRPFQHTFTIFSIKIMIDYIQSYNYEKWSQYSKGAFTGLLSFIIGRPLDQIDIARDQILKNQKKKQSRWQGFKVVLRHDGFKGFYKNQNFLGPLCATIYRSIFFGMWDRLNCLNTQQNIIFKYILIPFTTSLCSSIATFLPDKFRSFCYNISFQRSQSIQKKYRKKNPDLKQPLQLLLKYIASDEFKVTKTQLRMTSISIMKNWLILSLFIIGQQITKEQEQK